MNEKYTDVKVVKATDQSSEEITIKTDVGNKVYRVYYLSEDEKRKEAIQFFNGIKKNSLFPDVFNTIPPAVRALPVEKANEYLKANPQIRKWFSLQIYNEEIKDTDLHRLEFLSELKCIMVYSGSITDAGIVHLKFLKELQDLILYSMNVSDNCLSVIKKLTSLESLDMQDSHNISDLAYTEAIKHLPRLKDSYPPSFRDRKKNKNIEKKLK